MEEGAVDHVRLALTEVTDVPDSSSCYLFDCCEGRRAESDVLTLNYGELSHFCDACWKGDLVKPCTAKSSDGYFGHSTTIRCTSASGLATRKANERKEKLARAKNFISNAKSGEWILVRMSNTNHNSSGGQTQEEEELGGKFAPFQLIDQHAVQGHKTIPKDNSKMYFLRVWDKGTCEKKESRYSLPSLEKCSKANCDGTACNDRHEGRVALEDVISSSFRMPAKKQRAQRSSSSSSSSSSSNKAEFELSPSQSQKARAVVKHDNDKYVKG